MIMIQDETSIPNIYVDTALISNIKNTKHLRIIKTKSFNWIKNEIYKIKGKYFQNLQLDMEKEEFIEFEVGVELKQSMDPESEKNSNMDSPGEKGVTSDTAALVITIQNAPNGVIVNSNVFLTEKNWHTLVHLDGQTEHCAVCDIRFKTSSYQDHISTEEHMKNLDTYMPLSVYDLCIMRKIKNKYHCGVCNELIDVQDLNDHLAYKIHEDKLLFAVNRVSDIMYDLDIHNERNDKDGCYHFNARTINNRNNVEEDADSSEGFYDYYPDKPYNHYSEKESIDDNVSDIEVDVNENFSYASIARTPRTLPKFLEIKINGKDFKVHFDSWHMIIVPKANWFYCMACKIENHVRWKSDHCTDVDHLAKLEQCEIIDRNDGFLVRRIDHRLCHCAHCNSLQLIREIYVHIEAHHQIRKNKNLSEGDKSTTENTVNKVLRSNSVTQNVNKNANVKNKAVANATDNNKNTTVNVNTECIKNKVKELCIFCSKFTLSLLSYNMILCSNGFHCCACEVTINADDISRHISEVAHKENLMMLPFIFEFNSNLIRSIRNGLHCAICNIPVAYGLINMHIVDPVHMALLNKAITTQSRKQSISDPEDNRPSTSRKASLPDQNDSNQFSILNQIDVDTNNEENHSKHIESVADDTHEHIKEEIVETDKNIEIKYENECKVGVIAENTEEDAIVSHKTFDTEEFVYLKLRNNFMRITLTSYNTLFPNGDGTRHCCLCSTDITLAKLGKHVDSREHVDNIRKYKFLNKYEKHLLRQVYLTYHCGVCNVTFSRRDLSTHLSWAVHLQQLDNCHKIDKKSRRAEIKNGVKQIKIALQNETIYLIEVESRIKIIAYMEFVAGCAQNDVKKSKIVIFDENVLKINWDTWHGFVKAKAGHRCCLCQKDLKNYEMSAHAKSSLHVERLETTFLKKYKPALIRKINESTLNCVTCNAEVSNIDHIISEHLKGKKHKQTYEAILQDSSQANTYSDCIEDVFTLQ